MTQQRLDLICDLLLRKMVHIQSEYIDKLCDINNLTLYIATNVLYKFLQHDPVNEIKKLILSLDEDELDVIFSDDFIECLTDSCKSMNLKIN